MLDFLYPIEDFFTQKNYIPQTIGGRILKHTRKEGLPSLEGVQIAVFSLSNSENILKNSFREYFYSLYYGNWDLVLADLGNIPEGTTQEDTFIAIRETVSFLMKQGIIPVFLASGVENTYALYRAFDSMEQMVNLACVSPLFGFGDEYEIFSEDSYMSRILMETPTHLNHFSNIGYQTYYNPQESKDLLDKMFFESYRLGEITSYMEQVEPILRNTDLVSIDMAGVQAADIHMPQGYVNGFSAREICAISRYAGLSSQTAVLGLFNVPTSVRGRMLIGEVIWYFIEGVNYRIKEFPTIEDKNYTKHIVLLDDFTIEFYKSNRTGRWWILPSEASKGAFMLPCTERDYQKALEGIIPLRWWNLHQRSLS